MEKNIKAFLTLLRAGLFPVHGEGGMVHDSSFKDVDWEKVYQLAQEQAVVGLALQGIDWFKVQGSKYNIPQVLLLQWIGEVQVIEQRNRAMNAFIADLIEKLRKWDVYTLLVKGQGVAQCYEKPLWRICGDVDLFLNNDNYEKAKEYLTKIASHVDAEREDTLHLGMTIDGWVVELHGSLRCGLSQRVNMVLEEIRYETFFRGNVRSWQNGNTQVFLMGAENDIIYVFIHFLSHFYYGGIGLRQICDWCRLLYTYRDSLDYELLESRIKAMGLMTEWKTFAALAVEYLGMPKEAMPFYSDEKKWKRKADKIKDFVLKVGNFGKNRDTSYYSKYPFYIRKAISFGHRCGDMFHHTRIFPLDSLRFFPYIMFNGVKAALNGVHKE